MIGTFEYFDADGKVIYVSFTRVDGRIRITGAHRSGGEDCFGNLTSKMMTEIRSQIISKFSR